MNKRPRRAKGVEDEGTSLMKNALLVLTVLTVGGLVLLGCTDQKKPGSAYQGDQQSTYLYTSDSMNANTGSGSAFSSGSGYQENTTTAYDSSYNVRHTHRKMVEPAPAARTPTPAPARGEAFAGEACPESRDYWADLEPAPQPKPAGMAHVDVKTGITSVNYRIDVANVDNITGAFIHQGQTNGKLGPVIVTLYQGEAKSGSAKEALSSGSITADKLTGPLKGKDLSTLADEIRNGNAFVRVTTTDRPEGVLVGKLGYNAPSDATRSQFSGESKSSDKDPADPGAMAPARNESARDFFSAEDRGPMFMAVLTPPKDMPDAKAHLWLASNKAMDELQYRLMLKDVKNPTGAELYLVETPATKPSEKAADDVGTVDRTVNALEKAVGSPVTNLGEPIAKLHPSGEVKEGAFTGTFADGKLTKDDLMGALKGKDLSALIDHIRAGHVYVAVMTDTYKTGQFQGMIRLHERTEKDTGTTP